MSANAKSLVVGSLMVIVGIVPRVFGAGISLPIVSMPAIGLALIVLGALELVVTTGWMVWSARKPPGPPTASQDGTPVTNERRGAHILSAVIRAVHRRPRRASGPAAAGIPPILLAVPALPATTGCRKNLGSDQCLAAVFRPKVWV